MQNMSTNEALSSGSSLESDSAQGSGGLGESSDSLNQLEDCSPPTDISSILRSVALMHTLALKPMHSVHVPKLFSVPRLEADNPMSPLDDRDKSTDGASAPAEEEQTISFQSKFRHLFPLYQDYFLQALENDVQVLKHDVHKLNKRFVSELITPQCLPGVHCHLTEECCSAAASHQFNSPKATPSSPVPHPARVTPSTFWQDLEDVKESGLLSSLTSREIRLQESMFELISSEVSYLNSLGIAVNHFYASAVLKRTLTQMEHQVLFYNIQPVMAASEKFLIDLEMRQGECVLISQVEDIVLQHCSKFYRLYVPYVTNMKYQESLVNQLLKQNRNFLYYINKLERDPVCQRMSLKSFLVLPFQRITRLKLILERILKLTAPDSDSVSNLEKAIEAIHEIVTECDKRVQRMKQIEELVCLEMLLDFGKVKSVPLVVSERFLVRHGPMRQRTVHAFHILTVSFISIYLHLFNDLLIISSKKAPRFTVMDHAAFASHVHVEHLNTKVMGLPPHAFMLHLSQSQTGQPTAMMLIAHTRSEKEEWMKALSSEQ